MPVTPLRRRIPARLLLVGVFVLLALGAGAGAALTPTAAQATGPVYACALKGTGDLRYVTTPECTGRENLVDLVERRDRNGKKLCGRTATGVLRFIFDTSTCQRPEFTLVVPADTPTSICVRNDTGVMRLYDAARGFAPCNPATEFALVVTRPPNLAPVAVALNATALEDGGAVPIVLSATDEDGDPLSFAIVAGPGAGSLADGGGGTTCTDAVPSTCTATVLYTPAANVFGADGFTYEASDGRLDSAAAAVAIDVVGVNDAPDFAAGPDVTVAEDSGGYAAAWASGMTAGPANEAGQALGFAVVANANPGLFAAGPAVAPDGTLSFTPAADANGSAVVDVQLFDDGGTANGGDDSSSIRSFTIAVTPLNDPPSFAAGPGVTVAEDSGAFSAAWATGMSPGPGDEAGQATAFAVSVDDEDKALFAAGPDIAADGTLTFTPAPDANGVATVRVRLRDDGGVANPGDDDISGPQELTIAITAVNDAPAFAAGPDVSVAEDSGAYSAAWATGITAGPADEAAQVLAFEITANDNEDLFAAGPTVAPDGTLSFTPAADANGSASIGVRLLDDGGTAGGGDDASSTQMVTIAVGAVNDPPAFTLPASPDQTVAEDAGAQTVAGFATGISAGPADEAGQNLTFAVASDNDALFAAGPAIDEATGDLTYTPAANASGTATVTVSLADDGGTAGGGDDESAAQTFAITVTAVNDAPTAAAQSVSTNEDTATTITLAGGDADGDGLTFAIVDGPANGSLGSIGTPSCAGAPSACTATVTYTPNANFNGSDGFTFAVNDGSVDSAAATVTIAVAAVNDAPVAAGQSVSANEDTARVISLSASDVEGGALTFAITGNPAFGTLGTIGTPVCAAGICTASVTYTPAANANGADGFLFTASDGTLTSAAATVAITVTAVNDAPSFTSGGTVTVLEDSGAYSAAWATTIGAGPADESGQTVAFVITDVTNPDVFQVQPAVSSTGVLSFTPAPDANVDDGVVNITLRITDDGGTANGGVDAGPLVEFAILITPVNDEPGFTSGGDVTVDEDSGAYDQPWATNLDPGAANESGQTLTFVVTDNTNPDLFSSLPAIDGTTGNLGFTPAADANGSATITVTVTDDGGTANGGDDESPTQQFTITVDPVNDPPSFTGGGDVTKPQDNSPYSAPWATAISAGPANESGQTVEFVITNNSNPSFFVVPPAISPTGVLTFDSDATTGSAEITVVLRDSGSGTPPNDNESTPVTFTITANTPPTIAAIADLTILEDAATGAITVTIDDPDGDETLLTLGVGSDNTTLLPEPAAYVFGGSGANRTLTVTPAANRNGSALITVTVTDPGGLSASESFTLSVTAVNDAPTAAAQSVTTDEDTARTVTLSGGDIDGNALTFAITGNPALGTLGAIGAVSCDGATPSTCTADVLYTPTANANGADGFLFTVNDGTVTSPAATVSVTVTSVNDVPTAAGQSVSTDEDTATAITLSASDIEGSALTFAIGTGPVNGTLGLIGTPVCAAGTCTATVTYTPNANFNGSDSFTFTVNDGTATSAAASVTITVNAVNDAPVLANIEGAVLAFAEGDAATAITSSLTVNDVDTATLTGATVQITAGYANGQDELAFANTASITGAWNATTGTLTLTGSASLADYQAALRAVTFKNASENPSPGSRTIAFRVNDGQALNNLSNIATRSVTVAAVNDAPVNTVPAAQTTAEDTARLFNAANGNVISVADVDAGASAVQVTLTAANGTVTLSGIAGLTFTAGDGAADATMTFTGTIANVNAALLGLSFAPAANFNDSRGSASLTILTNDQGNTGTPGPLSDSDTVAIAVTAANDAPAASARAFGADSVETNMRRSIDAANGLFNGATDPDTGDGGYTAAFTVGTVNGVAPSGGTVTATIAGVGTVVADAATGAFTFDPAPGVTGTVSFPFTVCDSGNPAPAQCSAAVNATFNISGPVTWFVNPAAATNGDGRLSSPFQFLTGNSGANNDADDVDAANHRIFVYTGTATGGITLNNGEWLIGQGVPGASFDALFGITVPDGTIARPSIGGAKPVVSSGTNTVGVTAASAAMTGIQIRGLSLASTNGNAIDATATGTGTLGLEIGDNAITGATLEGIDVNAGGSGGATLSIHDNTLTATGTALDVARTAGTVTITAFDDNVVTGASAGTGISLNTVTFDAVAGGAIQAVSGGTTAVGVAGDAVGGGGVGMTNVQGSLGFTDLDVFAGSGAGLFVGGTGGMILSIGAGLGTIAATGGPALDLTAVAADLQLASLTSTNSGTAGVSLATVTGTVTAPAGSAITNATGTDFAISGGTATVTYNGTITDDVGQLVSVSGATGGTKSFGGAITDGNDGDGSGISLTNNTGATITFSGGLTLSTGANPAFAATGGGTVTVTGTNTIATTTGTALNVANTTIGSNGLTFRAISAGTGSNSSGSGIVLNATGSGGLTVTGTGAAGTGGTIQNKTGDGVSLTAAQNVSLSSMTITGNDGSGVLGTNVTNFSITGSSVTNNADTQTGAEAGLRFNGLFGTSVITNTTFTGQSEDHVRITNTSGTLTNLTVSGSSFNGHSTPTGGHGVSVINTGASVATLTVNTSTFTGVLSSSVIMNLTDTAVGTLNIAGGTFTDVGVAVTMGTAFSSDLNFNISGTTSTRVVSNVIQLVAGSASTNASQIRGTIANNVIGNATAGSGHVGQPLPVQYGIALDLRGDQSSTIQVSNNTTNHTEWEGIWISAADFGSNAGQSPTTNLIVRDNAVVSIDDNGDGPGGSQDFPRLDIRGILIDYRHTTNGCLDIAGNSSVGSPGFEHVRVRQRDTAVVRLERFSDGDGTAGELINNAATVEAFLVAQNDAGTTADATLNLGFTEAADGACGSP